MPVDRMAWSVREFCSAVGISLATYKRFKRAGKGPEELRLSPKTIRIARSDAEQWLQTFAAANRSDANAA